LRPAWAEFLRLNGWILWFMPVIPSYWGKH
jgi:hypothetical protein